MLKCFNVVLMQFKPVVNPKLDLTCFKTIFAQFVFISLFVFLCVCVCVKREQMSVPLMTDCIQIFKLSARVTVMSSQVQVRFILILFVRLFVCFNP